MKLNYKRIFCVGFAFFLICAFWQAYDTLIPKILTDKFGLSQSLSGVIMAMDNVLALFLLPFFGSLSDRHNGKRGKRTPFILTGTILAAVLFITLSYGDYMQLNNISAVKNVDKASLSALYDQMEGKELKTPDGKAFVLSEDNKDGAISKAEFIEITPESDEHTEFVFVCHSFLLDNAFCIILSYFYINIKKYFTNEKNRSIIIPIYSNFNFRIIKINSCGRFLDQKIKIKNKIEK